MTIQELLEAVRDGNVTVKEAETLLKKESYEELGYAKLDTGRKNRTGFAEVVYCSGKADQHLLNNTNVYIQNTEKPLVRGRQKNSMLL